MSLAWLVAPKLVRAQEIKTELAERAVGVGDVFSIVISVKTEGVGETKVEIPRDGRPTHRNISYLRESQSMSFSSSIINGKVSAHRTIQKVLTFHAQRKGQVQIDSIPVMVNGRRVAAPGLSFEIAEQSAGIQGQGSGGRRGSPFDSMESLFSRFLGKRFDNLEKGNRTNDLDFFIDVEVSNMNPYKGEQFVVRWYLYANGRITDIDSLKYPALEGFWKEEISLAVTLNGEPVTRDGQDYTRYMLASYAITPIVDDQALVDTYEVKCTLTGLSFFTNNPPKEAIRRSDEALLNIKPLPQPVADHFSGLVGAFTLSGYVDRRDVTVGQPFTYNYKVAGIGQSKFMNEPELDFGPDFEVYDVTESSRFIPPNRTEKTYSYLLIPKNMNATQVPIFSSSFFDPEQEVYYTLETRPFKLVVAEGDEEQAEVIATFSDSKAAGSDFKPTFYDKINTNASLSKVQPTNTYILVYLASILFMVVFVLYQYYGHRVVYNFERDLNLRFEHLFSLIDGGQWRQASVEAVNIVYFFVNARSKRISRSQKLEDILTALPPSIRRKIELTLSDLNNDLQKFSFAPESLVVKGDEKDKVKEKCLALKQLFERSLKNEDLES